MRELFEAGNANVGVAPITPMLVVGSSTSETQGQTCATAESKAAAESLQVSAT